MQHLVPTGAGIQYHLSGDSVGIIFPITAFIDLVPVEVERFVLRVRFRFPLVERFALEVADPP
jgi:hypothetical protein